MRQTVYSGWKRVACDFTYDLGPISCDLPRLPCVISMMHAGAGWWAVNTTCTIHSEPLNLYSFSSIRTHLNGSSVITCFSISLQLRLSVLFLKLQFYCFELFLLRKTCWGCSPHWVPIQTSPRVLPWGPLPGGKALTPLRVMITTLGQHVSKCSSSVNVANTKVVPWIYFST